ncbi:MAG: histidine phosphatase family protein [Wujia sp.]
MKLLLIRHGATPGNLQGRYVGSTDEGITEAARKQLNKLRNQICQELTGYDWMTYGMDNLKIYVSPLKRTIETVRIIFPNAHFHVEEALRECDFGEYEYKNYEELKNEPAYQRFIDTMGESGFPGGETKQQFQDRCCSCYSRIVETCGQPCCEKMLLKQNEVIVIVAHGGTIMSILDRYSFPHRDYYDWQIKPGEGFLADMDGKNGVLTNIQPIGI